MSNSVYPHLLERKAKLFASLNRKDLVIMGTVFLLLSWANISGVVAVVINLILWPILKQAEKLLPNGFFREIFAQTTLSWANQIGGEIEKDTVSNCWNR